MFSKHRASIIASIPTWAAPGSSEKLPGFPRLVLKPALHDLTCGRIHHCNLLKACHITNMLGSLPPRLGRLPTKFTRSGGADDVIKSKTRRKSRWLKREIAALKGAATGVRETGVFDTVGQAHSL
jgi:hypothetical protein